MASAEVIRLREEAYDIIKDIRDPEKPQTLEELNVLSEDGVEVQVGERYTLLGVTFVPTVPHCHLATLIGLCIRAKLERDAPYKFKVTLPLTVSKSGSMPDVLQLDVRIKEGTHVTGSEISKQINDKERVAAAMENATLREMVERCIAPEDY